MGTLPILDSVGNAKLWWNGPERLQDRNKWPPSPVTTPSPKSAAESKVVQDVLAAVTVEEKPDKFDQFQSELI